MRIWSGVIIIILCVAVMILLIKIYLMRKAALEIKDAFEERLQTDTNAVITLSCKDKHMRGLATDINMQLKELRAQRRRYQNGDLEVKNAITNISHDIRTPLTAVCGYLELLSKEEVSEDAQRYIGIIENRVDMLRHMTDELFDYSFEASADTPLQMEPVDVNRLLQESIASFYTDFMKRGITPKIEITEKRIMRQADSAALSRVFSNLLSNALKYSDGDCEITLEEDGEIRVTNTAADLNNVEVGRLFDRFYTVETARKSTGLGLSIAKVLVEKMGGEISAEYEDSKLIIRLMLLDGARSVI